MELFLLTFGNAFLLPRFIFTTQKFQNTFGFKEILLEIGFIEEMRTTWGNKELPNFVSPFPFSAKIDLL